MAFFRGLEPEQEIRSDLLLRDTRPLGQQISDFFRSPNGVLVTGVVLMTVPIIWPWLTEVSVICLIFSVWFYFSSKPALPFRMPQHSGLIDPNNLHPGTGKPQPANGITFFGNQRKDGAELWFAKRDVCTHILMFGSTGAGKTEALISMVFNALAQGSGFIYVDGKGDSSLFSKIYAIARYMGREDDLLVINYMTGAKDMSSGVFDTLMSNTTNPFASGSSSMLIEMITSMMDSSSESKGGDMWKGRAISFMSALMMALVWMRDVGELNLDVQAIRDHLDLKSVEDLFFYVKSRPDCPKVIIDALRGYLKSIPGYKFGPGETPPKQHSETALEQHGYLQMQFTRILGSLGDTYGHIFKTNLGEIDFYDVVVNRRILVVLLPALEKSPDELANLGKIIVAGLKSMMASGLGAKLEGEYRDVIESKPTNAAAPFVTVLDEYGYYAVQGSAVMPAQARSLNFEMIFAGQDYPAFKKASPEEGASIVANCNIKIFGKLEDPQETYELFQKSVGEAYVSHTGGFQSNANGITNAYMDIRNASIEKRARGDLLDLKDQKEGEAHILFGSKIVRAKLFYANPPKVKKLRLNHFMKVYPPDEIAMSRIGGVVNSILESLVTKSWEENVKNISFENQEIDFIGGFLQKTSSFDPLERNIGVIVHYHNENGSILDDDEGDDIDDDLGLDDYSSYFDEENADDFDEDEFNNGVFSVADEIVGQMSKIETGINPDKKDEEARREIKETLNSLDPVQLYPMVKPDDVSIEDLSQALSLLSQAMEEDKE